MHSPLDLVIQPKLQQILDDFCALFGIRIAFFAATGEEVQAGQNRPSCEFCRLLREEPGWLADCRRCDARGQADARRTEEMVAYECHAGLTEAILPVMMGESLLGYIMVGQIRTKSTLSLDCARQARRRGKYGILLSAYRRQKRIEPTRVNEILRFLELLVEYISQQQLVRNRQPTDLQAVLGHLERNLHRNVTLTEAARRVHRSPTTLSHRFTKVLGKSFKAVQTEMKLAQAQRWLMVEPSPRVQDIARRLGYDDPLYFSRLFKKYRGRPPSRV